MRFRQAVAFVVLVTYLPSCMQWQVAGAEPRQLPRGVREIRVTLKDERRVVLENPQVIQDTLVGFQPPRGGSGPGPVRAAIPLEAVKYLEARKVDPGATVLLVGVAALAALAAVAVLELAAWKPDFGNRKPVDWTCYNAQVSPFGGVEE